MSSSSSIEERGVKRNKSDSQTDVKQANDTHMSEKEEQSDEGSDAKKPTAKKKRSES